MNADIRNAALRLSLEWGENFMAPIQARLRETFPELTPDQADELEKSSRQIQSFAFALYEELYFERMTRPDVEAQIKAKFPFLNDENMTRLYNQGMYYAWHG